MRDAVIVDAVRTPVGKSGGGLAHIHPGDLTAHVLQSLDQRNALDPSAVEDVVWGCVTQVGDQSGNIARVGVLSAGWPQSVPGTTIDRRCGSAQQAITFAAASVMAGHYDIVVAGGVESMSRNPIGSSVGSGQQYPTHVLEAYGVRRFHQGIAAEMIAEKWALSRLALDEYALRSHALAAEAEDAGLFVDQIAPLHGMSSDEGIRRNGSLAKLAQLKPAFSDTGVITAGNASQLSDGSAGLLITTSEVARSRGMTALARIHTSAVIGDDPVLMLTGPIEATRRVLDRSALSLSDIGVFEVNEAFASIPMAWMAEIPADPARVNPLGGAIAVGHPLGGSGAVLMTRMVHHMRERNIQYGLQTMCEGGGQANATILELL